MGRSLRVGGVPFHFVTETSHSRISGGQRLQLFSDLVPSKWEVCLFHVHIGLDAVSILAVMPAWGLNRGLPTAQTPFPGMKTLRCAMRR